MGRAQHVLAAYRGGICMAVGCGGPMYFSKSLLSAHISRTIRCAGDRGGDPPSIWVSMAPHDRRARWSFAASCDSWERAYRQGGRREDPPPPRHVVEDRWISIPL